MKYWLGWILIPLLVGCKSTIPSESITNGVIQDLNAHQQAIQVRDKQTAKECRTDAFVASLNALKAQTESIAGQVKSISKACDTEKALLEEKITIRDILITVLIGVLVLVMFFWVRFRK